MKKIKWKRGIAAIMAATMVFTMAAPAQVAYALNPGDPSLIKFDPKLGPDLGHSTYSSVPRDANRISTVTGRAGSLLTSSADFNGIPTENIGSGPRPKLPEFNNADTIWPGYRFDGWYDSSDNKAANLPYAFQYSSPNVYSAKWVGNSTVKFPFTVMHYRDLNPDRNAITDGTNSGAWPAAGDDTIIKFFESADWVNQVSADTPIAAGYKRNIPGYTVDTALIKNNWMRRFDDPAGAGTMSKAAEISSTNMSVKGNMPNDSLTVAYRYKPDSTKKFTLRAEYVDQSGVAIQNPTSSDYAAEAAISLSPATIHAYTLVGAKIKPGFGDEDNLAGKGIYSAASAGCDFDANRNFSGKMPNQAVIVTYVYEIDPDFTTTVVVNTVDNHNNILKPQQSLVVNPANPVEIPVTQIAGYVYPPNIDASGSVSSLNLDQAGEKLTFRAGIAASTVNITYNEDLNDSTFWGRVEYLCGRNGTLTGDTGIKTMRLNTYPLADLTAGVVPSPQNNYIFDGWYKANAAGTDKTGSKLTGDFALTENIKLFANFVEDPNSWFDLTFQAGSHGSISGKRSLHVVKGSVWSSLAIPTPTPENAKYMFDGWYDEKGNKVEASTQIQSGQSYIARFKLVSGTEEGIMAIPDTEAAIAADGTGQITISGASEARKYVLTDDEGTILAVMSGNDAKSKKFENLTPCSSYYAYEVSEQSTPVVGKKISECVDPIQMSQPAMSVVPALDGNYQAAAQTDDTVTVTVKPAASGVSYAMVDESGNLVGEWVTASGNPLTAKLEGLDPETSYTMVARPSGDSTDVSELILKGSPVRTPSLTATDERNLTFQIAGGGFVESITRGDKTLELQEGQSSFTVQAGDKIKINAAETDGAGATFAKWKVLFGSMNLEFDTRRNQTIEMPSANVLLQATYVDSSSPYAGVTVDYSPKNSGFALKAEGDALEALKEALIDNTADAAALAAGQTLEYNVKFAKRLPIASESNAVKEALEEPDGAYMHWALDTSLTRKLENVTKPLPADGNSTPDIEVYGNLDKEFWNHSDIQLWSLSSEADGGITVNPVSINPDPNTADSGFQGMYSFDAKVGDTIILTSYKSYQVTIKDNKRGSTDTLYVKSGNALEDADGYDTLLFHDDYIEPGNSQVWLSLGLAKSESSKNLYDTTEPVTSDMTLYAVYEKQENEEWLKAEKELKDLINIANALSNNAMVSTEDQEALKEAVKEATDILNSLPKPSLEQIKEAHETLKTVVDTVKEQNPGAEQETEEWKEAKKALDASIKAAEELRRKTYLSDEEKAALDSAIQDAYDLLAVLPCPATEDMTALSDSMNSLIDDIKDNHSGGGGTGGGGGSGGGGSSGGGVGGPGRTEGNGHPVFVNGLDGSWNSIDGGANWQFLTSDGTPIRSQWINVSQIIDGKSTTLTYHLNGDGKADKGWYLDSDGRWYYLSTTNDGTFGHVTKGWHFSSQDNRWYYLNEITGYMLTGWQKANGIWYYLSDGTDGRPQGALYANETTPDGFQVDANGARIKDMPE